MERSEFDPATDWSDHGPDTALEEPMQYLGLGGGGGGGDSAYPERSGEPDCIYYLRTGSCGFGARCRFNHPRDRAVMAYGGARAAAGDFPERAGQPVCQHYLRTGSCKFGSSCKYHHPRPGDSSAPAATLNFYGYPLRPGEKECSYYTKTGQCKFGVTCKFHHPQSVNVQGSAAAASVPGPAAITPSMMYPTVPHASAPSQQFGVVAGNWQVARPPMVPGSYIQGPYGPMLVSTGVVPVAGWTPYMASHSALAPPSVQSPVGAGQVYGMLPMSPAVPVYNGTYPPLLSSAGQPGPSSSVQNEPSHPERPGQPVCQHYLRTGECKYGSFCRYHHPAEWSGQKASFTLTPMGLPLRPGAPTCIHFTQHGVCRFGPTCKFNHPMGSLSYSPSASSLSDMPVAPYPLGSSIATLAPSSSSSDLRIDPSNNSPSKTSSLSSISSGTALSRSASISQPSPSPSPSSAKR